MLSMNELFRVEGQSEVVLENILEVLVEGIDPVRTVHGEHDHVLGGIKNGLKLGALGFRTLFVQTHVGDVQIDSRTPVGLPLSLC